MGTVADQAGLDVFGVGEHHREDFAVSSPQLLPHLVAPGHELLDPLMDHAGAAPRPAHICPTGVMGTAGNFTKALVILGCDRGTR